MSYDSFINKYLETYDIYCLSLALNSLFKYIEEKPNLRYRKANMFNLVIGNKISQIKMTKKAVIALFEKSSQKQVKSFMKSNKISIRNNKDLELLFTNFKNQVIID